MERAMSTVVNARLGAAVTAVVILFGGVGCTICPDPFDYAGPVPDGTPPQNDFRARSGGILPVGAAPKPWPPVVRQDGQPETEPVLAEPDPLLAVEPEAAPLRQASILVPDVDRPVAESDEAPGTGGEAADDGPAIECEPGTPLEPVPEDEGDDAPQASGGRPAEPAPPAVSGSPETPGWRPRHRAG